MRIRHRKQIDFELFFSAIYALITGVAAFSAIFLSTSASAVAVMEMEGVVVNQDTPYIESGYTISAPGEHLHAVLDEAEFDNGVQMANDTHGMLWKKVDSGQFDLVSLFALKVRGTDVKPSNPGPFALQIDGVVDGAVTVSKQLFTGDAGTINFLSENALWSGLDEVQIWYESAVSFGNPGSFTGDNFEFDTLTFQATPVSNVPVPAAVWMFFSALGGLGLVRRKQITA